MAKENKASRKELQGINQELKRKRFELEVLKSLNDRLANLFNIEIAIDTINDYIREIIDYTAVTFLIADPSREGDFRYRIYISGEVGVNYINDIRREIGYYIQSSQDEKLRQAKEHIDSQDPEVKSGRLSQDSQVRPQSKMLIPMKLGNADLGLVHISSGAKGEFEEDERSLIESIIITFILYVVRLRTLVQSQRSQTEALVESLDDGVIMFDAHGHIALVNPAAARFTGIKDKEKSSQKIYRMFADIGLEKKVNAALQNGRPGHIEEAASRDRFFEIYITPVKDESGALSGCALVLHDITHLKEIDKMKSEFVSIASHQLRTPLAGIKWFVGLLLKGKVGRLKKEQRELLQDVAKTNNNMISLVNDLLNVSRIERGRKYFINKEKGDIRALTKEAAGELAMKAEQKKINLILPPPGARLETVFDQEKMKQAVHNLLNNALKYTPPKGRVEVAHSKENGRIIISVKDNGIGIPESQQDRIFEKMFRADNAVKVEADGNGLGLYFVKAIAEAHGGQAWFESEEGKGSAFYISLPVK